MSLLNKDIKHNECQEYFTFLLIGLLFLSLFCFGEIFCSEQSRVKLGNECLLEAFPPELQGKKLGLVINHTSSLSSGKSLVEALLDKGHLIQAIFSPEHGFSGDVEGGIEIRNSRFESIKIYSLYGKTKKPTLEQSRNIDVFIYDIQDVGTRFYTYITTLKYILEAAAEAQKPVYVLDRPNPVSGLIIEGPLLRPEFESFIGAFPIPVRYGLTAGELALMMNEEGWVEENADLHVIRMKKWRRKYFWKDTGLHWIPPSPNMPTPETAIIYPGTGLLGAINLNHGLGTSNPFLQFGSPWINSESIIKSLKGGREFGIELEAISYRPRSLPGKVLHPPYENKSCQGIRIHVVKEEKLHSLRFTLALIKALKEHYPQRITPHDRALNLMFGNDLLLHYIEGKITYKEISTQMEKDEKLFSKQRRKYLIYN